MGRARVEVLGPLRLVVDGGVVEVRGFKRRAVLARLALAEGRTVTADQLVDTLWPEEAPESGRQALHSLISRLRSQLGPAGDQLVTSPAGYRLDLGGDGLDLARARSLLRAAQARARARPGGRVRPPARGGRVVAGAGAGRIRRAGADRGGRRGGRTTAP